MKKKVLSSVEVNDILEELENGVAVDKIAAAHNVSRDRIREIRDNSDTAAVAALGANLTTEQKKLIKQMYSKDSCTVAEVVNAVGMQHAWAVMEFCESSIFDDKRLRYKIKDVIKMYFAGYENQEIADFYNVKLSAIQKITTRAKNEAILKDYKDGVSVWNLLDMYDMDTEELQTLLCKMVRLEVKGV